MSGKKKRPSALKHGVFSAMTVLPGESRTRFKRLRRDVITEYRPDGPVEKDIIDDLARFLWRKQNLGTLNTAAAARQHYHTIRNQHFPSPSAYAELLALGIEPDTPPMTAADI